MKTVNVTIIKKVKVPVSQTDIDTYRAENKGSMAGHLRKDTNLAKIIALDKAWEIMHKLDPSVETTTSIDDNADF